MRQSFPATLALCAVLCAASAHAQPIPFPSYAGDADAALRLALRAGAQPGVQLALQPFTYGDVSAMLAHTDTLAFDPGLREAWQYRLLRSRLAEALPQNSRQEAAGLRGWLNRTFYTSPGQALVLARTGFRLFVNPVLDLQLGAQRGAPEERVTFLNSRGVTARGDVDGRVYFQTTFTDNQAQLPAWEQEWRGLYAGRVPGVGFYKRLSSNLEEVTNAVDYIQATGEVGFRLTRHIAFRFGHGNPRLGNGYRSLLLDDFADPYLYGEIDTRIWRIHYRNLYTQLQDGVPDATQGRRKYFAAHTLGVQVTDRWEVGVTEAVVFARDSSGFDAQYLNPIILYRAVEGDNGSPDNALFGLYTNVRLGSSALVYGQFLFDEFKLSELTAGNGWWANKFAGQLGVRWFDVGSLEGFDLGVEANTVRPFTYAHRRAGLSYTHYAEPLAHPWGADLRELHVEAAYRIAPRWRLQAQWTGQRQGQIPGTEGRVVGSTILVGNDERPGPYGFETAAFNPISRDYADVSLEFVPLLGSVAWVRYASYASTPSGGATARSQGVTVGLSVNAVRRSGVF